MRLCFMSIRIFEGIKLYETLIHELLNYDFIAYGSFIFTICPFMSIWLFPEFSVIYFGHR